MYLMLSRIDFHWSVSVSVYSYLAEVDRKKTTNAIVRFVLMHVTALVGYKPDRLMPSHNEYRIAERYRAERSSAHLAGCKSLLGGSQQWLSVRVSHPPVSSLGSMEETALVNRR